MVDKMRKLLTKGVATVVVLAVVFVVWFAVQVRPLGGPSAQTGVVSVSSGDTDATIASKLEAAGIISSSIAFRIDLLLQGSIVVQPGSYLIHDGSSYSAIRSILEASPNVVSLDVLPGQTLYEIDQTLAADEGANFAASFQAATQQVAASSPFGHLSSLEGLIGSGEYLILPGSQPSTLAERMAQRFIVQAKSFGLTPSTKVDGHDAYQIITIASIVEKEGYYPSNMPKVARVIYNRLARGGGLQMDATVLYALHLDGGQVTHAMLQLNSPYNTYLSAGLTPTPIATISSFSTRAALHPPAGTWLYFVVIDKSGDEAFSTTFAQQLANERLANSRGLS
jgi:UPF0755 protein